MAKREPVAPAAPEPRVVYDEDFYAWTQATAALLRAGRFADVDVAHVAEEVEDMGKRDRRELDRRLQVLLVHLLKWQHQSGRPSAPWKATVIAQRSALEGVLRDSPSLRPRVAGELARNYGVAVQRAAAETGLASETFPADCPWSAAQLLDESFLPGQST